MYNEEWALYLWLKFLSDGREREARKRVKDKGEKEGGERRGRRGRIRAMQRGKKKGQDSHRKLMKPKQGTSLQILEHLRIPVPIL